MQWMKGRGLPQLPSKKTMFGLIRSLPGRFRAAERADVVGGGLALVVVGLLGWHFLTGASAAVANDGNHFYGDGTLGQLKFQTYTGGAPGTMGAEVAGTSGAASAIQFVVAKSGVARVEKIVGYQKAGGSLDVSKCTGPCSTGTDLTLQFTINSTGATTTQGFDIAYEQLSGRGMIVYSNNVAGKAYYCLFDGAWSPSSCTPGVSNEIVLNDGTTALTGVPKWIRLVPRGEQMGEVRTNEMLMAVEDANGDIYVTRWTGSAWSTTDDLVVTDISSGSISRAFDLFWETLSGAGNIVYGTNSSGGTNQTLSHRSSSGSGWSAPTDLYSAVFGAAPTWVRVASDPLSNRAAVVAGLSTTIRPYIWKGDGSTATWVAGTDGGGEAVNGENLGVAWEKSNSGTPQALFVATANASLVTSYLQWTNGTGFGSWTAATGGTLCTQQACDDINAHQLIPSPNSDEIMNSYDDIDCTIRAREWGGSSWENQISTNMEGSASGCTVDTNHVQRAWSFAYKPYSAWTANWKWYDDEATAGNPTSALGGNSQGASVVNGNTVRLRFQVLEAGDGSQTDTRKKLQYATGAGCPDSLTCSWTDVGEQGSGTIWRYGNGGLADDAAVASTLLPVPVGFTGAVGNAVESGTAAAPNSDHAAGTAREYDYTLQNNGAAVQTVYYFRMYDYGASASGGSLTNLNPVPRFQKKTTAGAEFSSCHQGDFSGIKCQYPWVTTHDWVSTSAATHAANGRRSLLVSSSGTYVDVYQSGYSAPGGITFRTSTDNGTSWSSPTLIHATAEASFSAAIDTTDNDIFVTYGQNGGIYTRKLTFSGGVWSVGSQVAIATPSGDCASGFAEVTYSSPLIAVNSAGKAWLNYHAANLTANFCIELNSLETTSSTDGSSWASNAISLSIDNPNVLGGSYPIVTIGAQLWMVITSGTGAGIYKDLTSSGEWTLDSNPAEDFNSLSLSSAGNDQLDLFYYNLSGQPTARRYTISTSTLGAETVLGTATDVMGSLTADGSGNLWAIYQKYVGSSNYDIVYKQFNGASWDVAATTVASNGLYNLSIASPVRQGAASSVVAAWIEQLGAEMSPYMVRSGALTSLNDPPDAPTLSLPVNGGTGVSTRPHFELRTTEPNDDPVMYKIEVCSISDCSVVVRTIDQEVSQAGWSGMDALSGTGYLATTILTDSTLARHDYQAPSLSPGTQYWWRAYAIDFGASDSYSAASAISSFTTAGQEVRIEGGASFGGGVKIGP